MSFLRHTEVLAFWAQRAKRIPLPVSLPSWRSAVELTERFKVMSQAECHHLVQQYRESKKRFAPLSDPLDVNFHLHRQLDSQREEVYSDWLQWVLQSIPNPNLVGQILGCTSPERFDDSAIDVNREVCVERGHTDRTGRLDLEIWQSNKRLAAIEVKTRSYAERDLDKHVGYLESCVGEQTDFIFLAVNEPDAELNGFRFLSWAHVCIALRRIAPSFLASDHVLITSMILAFVGAVEQNLLGFTSPAAFTHSTAKIPQMVDHLSKALDQGAT